jgi:hypothetical protein
MSKVESKLDSEDRINKWSTIPKVSGERAEECGVEIQSSEQRIRNYFMKENSSRLRTLQSQFLQNKKEIECHYQTNSLRNIVLVLLSVFSATVS